MHKALCCTCSQKSPLPFPLLPNQLWYLHHFLLDLCLCLCNPLSLLLIGVECTSFCSLVHLHYATYHISLSFFLWRPTPDYRTSFCSSVHLHYATYHISLSFFLWCPTSDYRCSVDGSVDLGSVVASFFQHFSCPGSFLFLPSPLILMFIFCGWLSCQFFSIFVIPPLSLCWLLCHFFQSAPFDKVTFPLFLCTLKLPPLGSMGACSLIIERLW